MPSTDPLLDTGLKNNGGPTQTIALLTGSPAIDAIPQGTNGCGTSIPTDQRGVNRPQGTGCDIGAYEVIQPVTVASATGKGNITLTPMAGCWLTDVQAVDTPDDPGFSHPYGLVKFDLHCFSFGVSNDVAITFPGDISGMTYRKYGPTPPDFNNPQWYTFTNVAISGNTATLHLQDGALGDDTAVDGVIVDQGGPGQQATSVPTMNEWGMIIFIILAGLGAVYYLRRQGKA